MSDCPELVTLDLALRRTRHFSKFHTRGSSLFTSSSAFSFDGDGKPQLPCHTVFSGLRVPCLQRLHLNHFWLPASHIDMLLPVDFSFNPIIAQAQIVDISLNWEESMIEVNYLPSEDAGEPWENIDDVFSTTAPRGDRMVVEMDAICKFHYGAIHTEGLEFTTLYTSFIQRFCSPQTQEVVLCDLGQLDSDLHLDSQALFAHFNLVRHLEVQNGTEATGASFRSVMAFLKSRSEDAEMSGDEVVALPSLKMVSPR